MAPDGILAFFQRRKRNYQFCFGSPAGKQVLADLHEFCCAGTTTARSTAHDMAVREGRRQVWLRIERAIHLTPEETFASIAQKDKP